MTDKEIIKAVECCLSGKEELCKECPLNGKCYGDIDYLLESLDLINRQQEQLEAAIAGQETLQKALADKDREVVELNSDLKLLRNDYDYLNKIFDETIEKNKRLRDKVVGLTAEKDRLIETFGECQEEATKALAEKDKEIKRLNNNISAMAVTMHNCAKATRAEAIRAFAERLKEALPMECRTVVEGNDMEGITDTGFQEDDTMTTIDNLVKEMAGDTE